MNIIMSNIEVADFKGFEKAYAHQTDKYGYHQCEDGFKLPGFVNPNPHKSDDDSEIWHVNDLKFHESWDWLMPVIAKIEALDSLDLSKEYNKRLDRVVCLPIYSDINTVYKAVVKFIEWYKEQNFNI